MQTSNFFKFFGTLLVLLFSVGFHLEDECFELGTIFKFLQPLFTILMIGNLRTSLVCFYKANNTPLNFLDINTERLAGFDNLVNNNWRLFLYSNFQFFDKKYIIYCNQDYKVSNYLKGLSLKNERVDVIRKPYFLLSIYSIRLCLEAATWSLICLLMVIVLGFFSE